MTSSRRSWWLQLPSVYDESQFRRNWNRIRSNTGEHITRPNGSMVFGFCGSTITFTFSRFISVQYNRTFQTDPRLQFCSRLYTLHPDAIIVVVVGVSFSIWPEGLHHPFSHWSIAFAQLGREKTHIHRHKVHWKWNWKSPTCDAQPTAGT